LQPIQHLLPFIFLLPDLFIVLFVDLSQNCSSLGLDVLLYTVIGAVHLHLLRLQLGQLPGQFGEDLLAGLHVVFGLVHHFAVQVVAFDCS
jgi:hypothetical protein